MQDHIDKSSIQLPFIILTFAWGIPSIGWIREKAQKLDVDNLFACRLNRQIRQNRKGTRRGQRTGCGTAAFSAKESASKLLGERCCTHKKLSEHS